MPNRIIRDAILSSEKMALLGWPEEVFYRRLMSIVDDYGRYEANPQLLRARCYPLQTDTVRVADITRWMAACQNSGLILDYAVSGKRYLEIINFQQQQRSASKYPPPTSVDINCSQAPADAHLDVSVFEVVSGGVVDSSVVSAKPGGYTAEFEAAWRAYPPRPGASKAEASKAWMARLNAGVDLQVLADAVTRYAAYCEANRTEARFIKHPATFFGPDEHYLCDWTPTSGAGLPPRTPQHQNATDRRAATLAGLTNRGDDHAASDRRTVDVEARHVG